jgi:hypothetical protein
MANKEIEYIFTLPDGNREVFLFAHEATSMDLTGPQAIFLPYWTELDYHRCPNCPLNSGTHPRCPLAACLVPIVHRLGNLLSWDQVRVEVVSDDRTVSIQTSAQQAIGSLIGLINATSGCPHLAYFRPMARFHLPFASRDETIYRATSMYLLAQFFRGREGYNPDFTLRGLQDIYRNVQIVNSAMVDRLRNATIGDYMVNAVVFLDLYAMAVQMTITDTLEDVRHWFTPYLKPLPPSPEAAPSVPGIGPLAAAVEPISTATVAMTESAEFQGAASGENV